MDFILNTKVARYLFALVIAMFGIAHFMNTAALAGAVPSFFPNPSFWVYLTGIAHLAAAVSIIVNSGRGLA